MIFVGQERKLSIPLCDASDYMPECHDVFPEVAMPLMRSELKVVKRPLSVMAANRQEVC